MSKFLSIFIQKTSGSLFIRYSRNSTNMSKRTRNFHRAPKFKPEMRSIGVQFWEAQPHNRDKVEVLTQPIKSASDKKLYKVIRLNNGLTALLISDPTVITRDETSDEEYTSSDTDGSGPHDSDSRSEHSASSDKPSSLRKNYDEEKLAACALCVGVGSYSDPDDIQGLAHFVEHMVFMGSSKFPQENEFDAFIKKKGGSDNASTDCEMTTFYFEIQEKYLPESMDMFSQFFVSPLMKKDSMQREREAIESEFAIAKPLDSNRKEQLISTLFPADHPARTFTWGNLKSLRDELQNDEKLHKAAHEFRQRHYSAHRMTLAVQARMDLDSLEKYVTSTFGNIPNNNLPPEDFSPYKFHPDMITPEFASLYYIKPVSDASEIHLTWCMRPLISEYKSKPHQYISYLLGHEGKGSLLSYLRQKVWALGLYTGNTESGIDYTSIYSLFSTQIILTKDGLEHVDEVLTAVFSYLTMLRDLGPSERIYQEIKTIEENSFRFEEEHQPSDYVESLAENMHFYPPEHYITGDRLYYKYDPEGISNLLDLMQPDNVNIMIMSNKHQTPIEYNLKEKWFGTDYRREEIPASWIRRWSTVTPYSEFRLPAKNIYIATNFDIIPPPQPYVELAEQLNLDLMNTTSTNLYNAMEQNEAPTAYFSEGNLNATVHGFRLDQPNLFRKNRQLELWYKPDFRWRFPTALLYFYFITPLSLRSPKDACLLDLWTDVFQQGLKEEVYPADMADLSHSLFVGDKGLTLKIAGYSQNLHLLVELITSGMRTSTDNVKQSLFEAVRDVRSRLYHNVLMKPVKLSKDVRMNILLEPYVSPRDKVEIINSITLNDLKRFSNVLFDEMYLQVLIQGNLNWTDAIRISEKVVATVGLQGITEQDHPKLEVRQLPLGDYKVRVMSFNKQSTNSIITNYYQAGYTNDSSTAILEILMMLMEEPVFDMLRTKEQLGYSVFSMMRYTFGVLGFSVTVNAQANKFSVAHVDSRMEAFLKKFAKDMKKLNYKTLLTTQQALVQIKHNVDYELKEEIERNWREVSSREYKFQRLFEEAKAIEKVTLQDIRTWIDNHFATGNKTHFRKLSVQVMGHITPEGSVATVSNETLNDQDYKLQYLGAGSIENLNEKDGHFITNLTEFRENLPIIEVPSIELAGC